MSRADDRRCGFKSRRGISKGQYVPPHTFFFFFFFFKRFREVVSFAGREDGFDSSRRLPIGFGGRDAEEAKRRSPARKRNGVMWLGGPFITPPEEENSRTSSIHPLGRREFDGRRLGPSSRSSESMEYRRRGMWPRLRTPTPEAPGMYRDA